MVSFAYPTLLWILLAVLVPVVILLYIAARYGRLRKLKRFGRLSEIAHLMPKASKYTPLIKICCQVAALVMLIIAVARPWGGLKDEKTSKEGIEVVIAVDASNSMLASATTDENGTSRMRTAKMMLERLIGRLDNDRVGLIVYAGDAFTLIPVTNDYTSARMFLNSIEPTQMPSQGTNIAAAIDLAVNSFSPDKKKIGRAIVLITDAEELEDEQSVMDAAKNAAKNGVQLDVIGVGSSTPVKLSYRNNYFIDPETGEPVETRLNEDLAAQIAKAGDGIYVNASNREALNELEKQLDSVKKSALQSNTYAIHDELYYIFAWIAFAFLIIDIFVLERKNGWLARYSFFNKEAKQ